MIEKPQKHLPNGWRLGEPYTESKQADYVAKMVEELKAIPRMKRAATTEQEPSTQALLDAQRLRPEWQDEAYSAARFAEPLDLNAQVRDKDGNVFLAERSIGNREYETATSNRKAQKNTIGQSETSAVTPELRQKGIEAYTYSKPAILTPEEIKKVTRLEEMASTPLEPEEAPKKSWKNLFGFLQGNAGLEVFKAREK